MTAENFASVRQQLAAREGIDAADLYIEGNVVFKCKDGWIPGRHRTGEDVSKANPCLLSGGWPNARPGERWSAKPVSALDARHDTQGGHEVRACRRRRLCLPASPAACMPAQRAESRRRRLPWS
jgi:hypothetical protein